MYNHVIKNIVVSIDVKFLEYKCWSDPLDIHQQESLNLSNIPIILSILEVHEQEEKPEDGSFQKPEN